MTPKYIVMHWNAGGRRDASSRYHRTFLDDGDEVITNADTVQLSNHTGGHNTDTLAYTVAAMQGDEPKRKWRNPPTRIQLERLAHAVALACIRWKIPIDREHVKTHAEVANDKGYGPMQTWERWDLAALSFIEMKKMNGGDRLRTMAKWYWQKLTGRQYLGPQSVR